MKDHFICSILYANAIIYIYIYIYAFIIAFKNVCEKKCDQNIHKLGIFASFAKIICKDFAIYGMKQKLRDFTLE